MDKLLACAKGFEALLNTQYYIVIGRKGTRVDLHLNFSKWDFHHLMGLGKLKNLDVARKNRTKVFEQILAGKITYDILAGSGQLEEIEDRFEPLTALESILDDNRLVFSYLKKNNPRSAIDAKFLLSTPFMDKEIFTFLDEREERGIYYCRSFFPRRGMDYKANQSRYTMLYKEKIDLLTGESFVQYDKLTPRS